MYYYMIYPDLKLKTTLTYSTVMQSPDPKLTFLVQTDPSDVGIGVILRPTRK